MRLSGRGLRATVLAVIGLGAPAIALANDDFADVATTDFFHDSVGLIAEAGVTAGCQTGPPALYCPNDPVTRGQMGVFMAKLGGLGTNPPVADALTAQTATNATNSEAVDGFDATDLTRAAGDEVAGCSFIIIFGFDCAEVDNADFQTGNAILTADIEAPVDGAFIITWTLTLISDVGVASNDNCASFGTFVDLIQRGPASSGIFGAIPYQVSTCVADQAGVPNDRQAVLSSTLVVPVAAGPHTVDVRGDMQSGDPDHDGASMSVQFVPFDGDAVPPFLPPS